jgi:hypothetical protein
MVRDLVRILEFLRVVVVVSSSRVVSLLIYGGINKKICHALYVCHKVKVACG